MVRRSSAFFLEQIDVQPCNGLKSQGVAQADEKTLQQGAATIPVANAFFILGQAVFKTDQPGYIAHPANTPRRSAKFLPSPEIAALLPLKPGNAWPPKPG